LSLSLSSPSSSSLSSNEAIVSALSPSPSTAASHILSGEVSDKHRFVSQNGVHTLSFNVAGKEFQFETGSVLID